MDGVYDRLARGIYGVLGNNALLADADGAEELMSMQTKLFPNGLANVNRTYLEESGKMALIKGRLTEDDRQLLATVPHMDGSLLNAVEKWCGPTSPAAFNWIDSIHLPLRRPIRR
ncbi:MAG: hypothetical protein JXR76_20625 [Deltaproteobacteria bacterium]|nr:hypothetical protein [Deltaproteobacteria bacterium]